MTEAGAEPRTTIFDAIERTDGRIARHAEGQFDFLNRVDDPAFDRVRSLLETWSAVYPSGDPGDHEARAALQRSFRSDFPAAFWELYLHEVHRRAGFRATPHPEMPNGTRPDFLFEHEDGGESFYLEATVTTAAGVDDTYAPGTDEVFDKINQAYSPDFWVKVERVIPGSRTPAKREIIGGLERWLGTLSWNEVSERFAEDRRDLPTTTLSTTAGWEITYHAFPKAEDRRGDRGFSMIGIYPLVGGISRAREDVLGKLREKAYRYGELDRPFVIAINSHSPVASPRDIETALYGNEAVSIPIGEGADMEDGGTLVRDPHGLWQSGPKQHARRVSAVLGAANVNPYTVARTWPTIWPNPWADRPLPRERLPWPASVPNLEENHLAHDPATKDPAAFFDLPSDWPGQPAWRD